jgi:uncharacterized membrane protein
VTRSIARVVGLDVARALALFGMFAAHVGDTEPGRGWPWLVVAHGRSAALFAVLAGVSIALMYSRRATLGSDDRAAARHTRIRVAVRAALLIGASWGLSVLGTPVDVILDNLAVMMLLALAALRWRPSVTAGVGIGLLLAGFWLVDAVRSAVPEQIFSVPVVHELWSRHYPALSWVGYVLVGLALGRWAPWRGRALAAMGLGGLVLGLAALVGGTLAMRATGSPWLSTVDHSYTPVEMLSNVGFAAAVMAACLAAAPLAPRVVWPLAATGAMTLTLYSAHIVVIAVVGEEMVWEPSNVAWLALCATCTAFASLWRWRLGQGPLERIVSSLSSRAADADARRRAPGAPPTSARMGA